MSIPSNGITAEVIREIMPPYHLSADLLEATLAAIPAPPPDVPKAWRLARLTRMIEEVAAHKPANAEQARIAAEILITRELAGALTRRAHAPDLTTEQMCRLARAANALQQTAISLDRSLNRHQRMPVPFFGTVVQDEVDLAALDATWGNPPPHPDAASPPSPRRAATKPPPDAAPGPDPSADHPDATPPAAATSAAAATPTPLSPHRTTTEPATPLAGPAGTATHPDQNTGTTPEWTITKLGEGPGWTPEVPRHRSSTTGGNGSASGSAR